MFSPVKNLTVNAGVRYDHSSLLVSDQQFSPRVGAVYYVPGTKTAFRGSFNRLYMPPQIENLLLANSDEARMLSPFATGTNGGGSRVLPERVTAYEAAFAQDVAGVFRLDAACWWRRFRNIDDPNVLFNTTIIFPNSVARAIAHGVDVRLDLKERAGLSGYVSYGNSTTVEIGPINGGLFLTDDFSKIGPGTRFIPDHDQRNQGATGITYYNRWSGVWGSFSGSYQSGVPVGASGEALMKLQGQPGADLIDFKRGRVRPRTIFNVSGGMDLLRDERVTVSAQIDVQNIANERFVYNLDNPFSGTHFGYPREWSGRIRLTFR
jgi:outer membrane receptor protein involved in Fe transport